MYAISTLFGSSAINTHALIKMAYSSILESGGVAVVSPSRSSARPARAKSAASTAPPPPLHTAAITGAGVLLAAGMVIYGLILIADKTKHCRH